VKGVLVFLFTVCGAVAYAQAPGDRGSAATAIEAPGYGQGDRDDPQQALARLQANARLSAETARVRLLQEPRGARKASQDTENRRRCESALQVAALCGTFAGRFYCDETGFRSTASANSTSELPIVENGARNDMRRCELQVRKGEH